MSGFLISTLSAYLMVELLVSVPARNKFITVATRLSGMNSVVGMSFSYGEGVTVMKTYDAMAKLCTNNLKYIRVYIISMHSALLKGEAKLV